MTADVPRRLPRTQGQRVQNVARTHAAQSLGGATAAARPVQNTTPTPTIYKPPVVSDSGGAVVLGSIVGLNTTSITSTGSGPGTSNAAGTAAVAVGYGAQSTAAGAVAIGQAAAASTARSVAVGTGSVATGLHSVGIGDGTAASASRTVALGASATATAINSTALGNGAAASGSGSVAIGIDASGVFASAPNSNDFVLGTANHHVLIAGALVLSDGSGGLWRITVSGGALSAVAYP